MSHHFARAAFLIAAAFFAPLSRADPPADAVRGPIHLSSQSPLQSLRLSLVPGIPLSGNSGERHLSFSETWTNVWVDHPESAVLDYEAVDSRLSLGWSLGRGWSVTTTFENRSLLGGRLDHTIQEFHEMVGLGLNGRDDVPRDSIHIAIRDPRSGKILFQAGKSASGSYETAVGATLARVVKFGSFDLDGSMTVRTNLGERLSPEKRGDIDAGLTAGAYRKIGPAGLYAGVGFSRFAGASIGGLTLEKQQWTFLSAIELPATERTSLIAQYLANQGLTTEGPLSKATNEALLGFRHRSGSNVYEIGLIENVLRFDNGPDFGLHFAVHHLWD
ncbi:MAG: DUF3187 family protein [Thermoanaerobaculia bacterium]